MIELPAIADKVSFWASVATLWSASGAWAAYVAATRESAKQDHRAVRNLIEGIQAELDLARDWASGKEGDPGYLSSKTREQLIEENPAWFYPSRMIFSFDTPALGTLTSSPNAKMAGKLLPDLVKLNYAIRCLLDYSARLNAFALADLALYQSVMGKLGAKCDASDLVSSTLPIKATVRPREAEWTPEELAYICQIFRMNAKIHQELIGGQEGPPDGLYAQFRSAEKTLKRFDRKHRKPKTQPWWFWILHIFAAGFFLGGIWAVVRWYGPLLSCLCR